MELLRTYMRHWLCALSLAALLAVLHGCVVDDVETQRTGSTFRMTVTVITNSSMGTRAHTDDYEEAGTAAEDFIDLNGGDFRIVLFDKDGEYLFGLDPRNNSQWIVSEVPGSNGTAYHLEGELEFPESIDPGKIEDIKDRGLLIMALANWRSIGGSYTGGLFGTAADRPKLDAVWKDGSSYNFTYTPGTGNETWRPNLEAASKKLIPMFGYAEASSFVLSGDVLYSNTAILMQRALAKIEVIDNLKQEGISLEDVTMTAYNGRGRFIPDVEANPGWDAIGSQVETSSLPDDPKPSGGLKFFHDAANKTWIAYVPEMQLAGAGVKEVSDSRTHLNVKVKGELEGIYEGATYPLHFARYDQNFKPTIPDDSWNHILRNHIYRFSVNKVGITAELHLHVIPWKRDADEVWDFTDHVMVQRMLTWINEEKTGDGSGSEGEDEDRDENRDENSRFTYGYESFDETDGEVVLWIDSNKILAGSFRISTPQNGRWYARLVPLNDAKTNAVTFVDANGNVMEPSAGSPPICLEVSGIIEQEVPARIYIRPTDFGNDDQSKFRLEFWVENLGVWMEVPMVEKGNYKCYTIVRKANKLE